jgi:hypothetical protein
MGSTYLIDAIVRQTTVLIATLATASGHRAPLAGLANQVFADLVKELKEQGLGNKVIADMFGLALRTYHNKVARLSESRSERGRSLWEAVLGYVQERGVTSRTHVLERFARDDDAVVRGVLKDLVGSGMLFQTGNGDHTSYRAAGAGELAAEHDQDAALANLLLVAIHRHGPIDRAGLLEIVPVDEPALERALAALEQNGNVEHEGSGAQARFTCDGFVIAFHDPAGWEAAVYDHYQAMVTALCAKLERGLAHAQPDEAIGGSTYSFDLWDGHPLAHEARGLLPSLRKQAQSLRARVEAYNERHPTPPHATPFRVVAYVGQTVIGEEANDHA